MRPRWRWMAAVAALAAALLILTDGQDLVTMLPFMFALCQPPP